MRVEKLMLQNYCQHRALELEFCPGLNVIVGPIGAGKSNILKAIRLAFTNTSGNEGNRSDDILYGSSSTVRSGVQLVGLHNDKRFFLSRFIQPSSRKFYWEGETVRLTSEQAIKDELQDRLGVEISMFDEFIVVPQGEIANILDLEESKRTEIMQRLVGLTKFTTRYTWLGRYLSSLQAPAILDNPVAIQQELDRLLHDRAQYQAEHDAIQLPPPQELENARRVLESRKTFRDLTEEKASLVSRLNMQEVLLKKAHNDQAESQKALEACSARAEQLHNEEHSILHQVQLADKKAVREALKARYSSLEYQRSRLSREPDPPVKPSEYHEPSSPAEAWCQQEAANVALLQQLKNLVETGRQVCPTCFRPVDQALSAPLEGLEIRLQQLQRVQKAVRDSRLYDQQLKACMELSTRQRQELQIVEKELQAAWRDLNDSPAELDQIAVFTPDLQQRLQYLRSNIESNKRLLEVANRNVLAAEKTLSIHLTTQGEISQQLANLEQKLQSFPQVSEQDVASAEVLLANHDALQAQVSRLKGSMEVVDRQLPILRDRLHKAQKAQHQLELHQAFRASLETVRGLCHRDSLPFELAKTGMLALAAKMNESLEAFRAQYRVSAGVGSGFQAHFFSSGQKGVQPDVRLSGGERAQFGLALRVAAHSIWAQELGFLAMDEPTYGFGPHDMQCVEIAIEQLRKLSSDQGLQVIVVTHETRLLPLFDKVIQIDT